MSSDWHRRFQKADERVFRISSQPLAISWSCSWTFWRRFSCMTRANASLPGRLLSIRGSGKSLSRTMALKQPRYELSEWDRNPNIWAVGYHPCMYREPSQDYKRLGNAWQNIYWLLRAFLGTHLGYEALASFRYQREVVLIYCIATGWWTTQRYGPFRNTKCVAFYTQANYLCLQFAFDTKQSRDPSRKM